MSKQPREQIVELDQSFVAYVKRQFKKNKRALFSAYFIGFMALVAISADFIANNKPLYCKLDGKAMLPVIKQYGVDLGLSSWDEDLQNIVWKDQEFESVVWPLIPYRPTDVDYVNDKFTGPTDKQRVKSKKWWHWLGTDDLGRDVLSGMIHATRIALSVGIISMGIAAMIGIFLGSIAGFFGDNRLRVSRIRFVLNIIFLFLGLFYAFGARNYALQDAFNSSFISGIGQFLLSLIILVAIIGIGNLLVLVLKKIPFLGKKMNVPLDRLIARRMESWVAVPGCARTQKNLSIARPSR